MRAWILGTSLVLSTALFSGCDFEEMGRTSDVKNLLSCTQETDRACIERLVCSDSGEGASADDILRIVGVIGNADVRQLALDGKEQNDEVWRYKLGKHTIRVHWCPPEWEGSISYVDVEEGY